jgi:hypothetical protein
VAEVDIDTWVSTLAIIGGMFALYFSLRREVRSDLAEFWSEIRTEFARVDDRFARVDDRFARLEARVATLDDRVYGLAVGMKPLMDEAAAKPHKA